MKLMWNIRKKEGLIKRDVKRVNAQMEELNCHWLRWTLWLGRMCLGAEKISLGYVEFEMSIRLYSKQLDVDCVNLEFRREVRAEDIIVGGLQNTEHISNQ